MATVNVEGFGPVVLPDNMTREEMASAIALLPKPETQRIRQFAQGATMGTADEAEALVQSQLKGTKYEDELSAIRGKLKSYQKAYPADHLVGFDIDAGRHHTVRCPDGDPGIPLPIGCRCRQGDVRTGCVNRGRQRPPEPR